MKTLIKNLLVIFALQNTSQVCLAFDSAEGSYLSQQDLYLVLKSVFVKPGLLQEVDADLEYAPKGFNKFYELGFINVESGQPMAQSPSESYILYIDIFINRAMNRMFYLSFDQFQKGLFSVKLSSYFNEKISEHYAQTGQVLSFQQYIEMMKFSSLSPDIQTLFVHDLLVFIYLEDVLVPGALMSSITNTIIPIMIAKDFSIKTALVTVIKKGIISDFFLKY